MLTLLRELAMLPIGDSTVALVSWLLSFLFARLFFSRWLFRDYEVKSPLVQVLFGASLTFSLSLFEMVLFEVTNVLQVASRQTIWRIDLIAMTYLIVLLLPFSLFFTMAREYGVTRRQSAVYATAGFALYMYLFWSLGKFLQPPPQPHEAANANANADANAAFGGRFSDSPRRNVVALFSIQNFVSRTSLLGVVFMAVLSGFGAVNFPYENMSVFWRTIAEEDIGFLEKRLLHNVDMVFAKKKRLLFELQTRINGGSHGTNALGGGTGTGTGTSMGFNRANQSLIQRAIGFFRRSNSDVEYQEYINALQAEIATLERLGREIFLEIHDMRKHQQRSEQIKTPKGRFFNLCAYVMSAFCLYKMFMSTFNVVFQRNRDKDPITNAVEKLLYIWPSLSQAINVRFISEAASLLFVGILVFSQTRGFLIMVLKMFRAWSSSVSSNSVVLWLAHLMGMYFVSSFVLMRMNLSAVHRERIDEVLGEIEFNVFHRCFDVVFVISATCCMAILFLLKFSKASRTQSDYSVHDKFP